MNDERIKQIARKHYAEIQQELEAYLNYPNGDCQGLEKLYRAMFLLEEIFKDESGKDGQNDEM